MLIAWNVCFCVEKQLTIYDASTRYSGNILGVVDQGVVLTAKSSSLSELNQSINEDVNSRRQTATRQSKMNAYGKMN